MNYKSLEASRGSVFRELIGAAKVGWSRAGAKGTVTPPTLGLL